MADNQGIPVLINLSSLFSYQGVPDSPIQMVTSGFLIPGNDHSVLRYHEVMQEPGSGTITDSEIQLVLKKNQVTMNRLGDYTNTMMFKKARRFETVYHTPYGDMDMAVYARDVRWIRSEGAGKVLLRYDLSMQGAYASTNELNLEYWIQESEHEGVGTDGETEDAEKAADTVIKRKRGTDDAICGDRGMAAE